MNYLSCDNVADAIRSLALVYQVSPEIVQTTYLRNWPKEFLVDTPCEEFNRGWLPWSMGKHVGSTSMEESISVCFYHRSRFDGSSDWFSEGLLNNADGAKAFFRKLMQYTSDVATLTLAKSVASKQINDRDGCCGVYGPHAFFSLDEAIKADQPGMDFNVPEFFMDKLWDSYPNAKALAIDICMTTLRPVIVKFRATPSDLDGYIACLWHYLHHAKFQSDCSEAMFPGYMGDGVSIPPENIVAINSIDSLNKKESP